MNGDHLPYCGWASSNQLKAWRAKTEVSLRTGSASRWQDLLLACWLVLEISSLPAPTSDEPIPLKIYFNLHILLVLSPGERWLIQVPGQKTPMQRAQEESFPGIWAGGDAESAKNLGDGEMCSEVLETGVEKSRFKADLKWKWQDLLIVRMGGWRAGRKPKVTWRLSVWAQTGAAWGGSGWRTVGWEGITSF